MRIPCLLAAFLLAALSLGLWRVCADEPGQAPAKAPATAADLRAAVMAGLLKLTEADVVKLLGAPAAVKRPGDVGADWAMHWDYATTIHVSFRFGKVIDCSGSFSDRLPADKVTLAEFKRLKIGMTEGEVQGILGDPKGTLKMGEEIRKAWGKTARLSVSFNTKGLVCGSGLEQQAAAPAGFAVPFSLIDR